jgi:hypothetical protein
MRYGDTWILESPAANDDIAYRLLDPPVGVRAQINGGPSGFECPWVGLGQSGVTGPDPATPVASPQNGSAALDLRPLAFVPMDGSNQGGASDPVAPPSTSGVTLRCAIPDTVRVAAGMRGLMVLRMADPVDALALPVTAVVGSVGQGQVVVVHDDGTIELRMVQLGVSDIYHVAITDGLEPAEAVLQNPTQADFAQAGQGNQ